MHIADGSSAWFHLDAEWFALNNRVTVGCLAELVIEGELESKEEMLRLQGPRLLVVARMVEACMRIPSPAIGLALF